MALEISLVPCANWHEDATKMRAALGIAHDLRESWETFVEIADYASGESGIHRNRMLARHKSVNWVNKYPVQRERPKNKPGRRAKHRNGCEMAAELGFRNTFGQ